MTQETKQTAVEWLVEQLEDFIGLIPTDIINKAKEIENEQRISAQMDMFNFLNNLNFGMQYLEKREQAEEFSKQYGGNNE